MHYLTYLAEKMVLAHKNQSKLLKWMEAIPAGTEDASLVAAVRAVLEEEVESGHLHYNVLNMSRHQLDSMGPEGSLFPEMDQTCKVVSPDSDRGTLAAC